MVALRSRRLEGIFGARLDAVSHAQVITLVTNIVTESHDLDFKAELYGRSDRSKRDLAGDVAALANTSGGVLVLGIAEDNQARATAAPEVALDNAEQDRIRQIVSELVHPTPVIDVIPVDNPQRPGHGFLLIAVPRSPMAPHAVKVDKGLRYPRRYGTTTTYLAESQVAAAYRERFAGFQDRFEDLAKLEGQLLDRLDVSDQTFVAVTLVPDMAGDFVLNKKTLNEFEQEVRSKDPHVIRRGVTFQNASVGSRRLIAHGNSNAATATYLACELHQSGAGAFATFIDHRRAEQMGVPSTPISRIGDEDLVVGVLSGLRFLARHARDRAAAGGNAAVRATLWPVNEETPAILVQNRSFGGSLGHQVIKPPVATGTFDLDDLAEDGAPLVAATSALTTGLIQHFGYPETLQTTSDGTIRIRYWHQGYSQSVQKWAEACNVQITQETVS
ncbi:AlbA family DNA-binding domain-containing protein [Streptomyces viridosporus]|uniref:AlbA family DNA-binding domain-containing protein n=1 Tax=Streptomyces viridosporus TaxID=67581 RepID=UPI00332B1A74